MAEERPAPLVWIIAGEPSGDLIGARLIAAMRRRTGGDIAFAGIGGEAMAAEGLSSLFPISDIALMGLVEILPRLATIRRRMRQTIAAIRAARPVVVVSIDVPGFCFDVWKGLRGSGIPLIHYVAPSVWAWRPDRARKFAAEIDHLLALLPFEPPYFEKEGLACTFTGHPVLEGGADRGDGPAFRARHGIAPGATVVGLLPGSRRGELKRLLPVFADAVRRLAAARDDVVYVVPAVSYLADSIRDATRAWPVRCVVVGSIAEKFDAMAAFDAALAASGTVSLELAMAGVPHAVAYRVNRLTAHIVRRLRGDRQRYVDLVNVLLDREAVPELLQDACTGERLAASAVRLLDDPPTREDQFAAFAAALSQLRPADGLPSDTAAAVVCAYLEGATPRPPEGV